MADSTSVVAARAALGQKVTGLDVLIDNAGISGAMPQPALSTTVSLMKEVLETNVFGDVQVAQAFIGLLR